MNKPHPPFIFFLILYIFLGCRLVCMNGDTGKYICIKEDKLAELDAEISFKQKRLNDIDRKIERMDEKIDRLNDSINHLIVKSQQDDNRMEQRLVALETKSAENEKAIQDNRNRFTIMVSVIVGFFSILTFIFNYVHF